MNKILLILILSIVCSSCASITREHYVDGIEKSANNIDYPEKNHK